MQIRLLNITFLQSSSPLFFRVACYDAFNASVIMCLFLLKSILYSCPPLSATPQDELIYKSVDYILKDKWEAVGVQGSQLHL